jgi:hypothetical protein
MERRLVPQSLRVGILAVGETPAVSPFCTTEIWDWVIVWREEGGVFLFCFVLFETVSLCSPRWPGTVILPISASQVRKISGVSHQHPTPLSF